MPENGERRDLESIMSETIAINEANIKRIHDRIEELRRTLERWSKSADGLSSKPPAE